MLEVEFLFPNSLPKQNDDRPDHKYSQPQQNLSILLKLKRHCDHFCDVMPLSLAYFIGCRDAQVCKITGIIYQCEFMTRIFYWEFQVQENSCNAQTA